MIDVNEFQPELVGRGQWHVFHTLSSKADSYEQREMVKWVIITCINNLRCQICFEHATNYLKKHPIEKSLSSKESLFLYLYNFHSAANEYAGKTSPSYEEVKEFYFNNNQKCTKTCGKNKKIGEVKNYVDI